MTFERTKKEMLQARMDRILWLGYILRFIVFSEQCVWRIGIPILDTILRSCSDELIVMNRNTSRTGEEGHKCPMPVATDRQIFWTIIGIFSIGRFAIIRLLGHDQRTYDRNRSVESSKLSYSLFGATLLALTEYILLRRFIIDSDRRKEEEKAISQSIEVYIWLCFVFAVFWVVTTVVIMNDDLQLTLIIRNHDVETQTQPSDSILILIEPIEWKCEPTIDGDEQVACRVCLCELKDGDLILACPNCICRLHHTCATPWYRNHAHCMHCRYNLSSSVNANEELS